MLLAYDEKIQKGLLFDPRLFTTGYDYSFSLPGTLKYIEAKCGKSPSAFIHRLSEANEPDYVCAIYAKFIEEIFD